MAAGQGMEFRVWAALIEQSRGMLHIFLPLLDRGLDAVVHRRTDGEYIPLQVKSRSHATNGFVQIGIPEPELVDDRALIIAGLHTAEGIGPKLLVVDEGTFKAVASRSPVHGVNVYSASFSMESLTSHWRPYLVDREKLGERLMGGTTAATLDRLFEEELAVAEVDQYSRWLGFLGEAEVIRRLAENAGLDLFRPFPDLEMVEVLARNRQTGRFMGLQVKAGVPGPPYGETRIAIRKASFQPAPTTRIVVLAWASEQRAVADECLFIPTSDLIGVAVDYGEHWVLDFHPRSQQRGRLDPYRRSLLELGSLVEAAIAL
jgi:hypothetical protein